MKVLITGSTGMVGKGVLFECLKDKRVNEILLINRNSVGISQPKITEIIHKDFFALDNLEATLEGIDACFFCLGITSFRMSEEDYSRITYDLSTNFADTLFKSNPNSVFCFVSGAGTDTNGSSMWQRVKGKTEDYILQKGFKDAYAFRPGYIQPAKGIRSKTQIYNLLLPFTKLLYPVFKTLFPNYVTSTWQIGQAMINVVLTESSKKRLESRDINRLADV
jgi:uncharacterized protein YbjT (DUF2867 family)